MTVEQNTKTLFDDYKLICSATGHRPDKIGGYNSISAKRMWVKEELRGKLAVLKPDLVISGMAIGVDQDYAWIAHFLGIPFVAAIPFVGQEKMWPSQSQAEYNQLLKLAKEVVIVSTGEYSAQKMQIRNQWMVDHCHTLVAVWDGSSGGTANCVKYAQKIGRNIERIDPREFEKEI